MEDMSMNDIVVGILDALGDAEKWAAKAFAFGMKQLDQTTVYALIDRKLTIHLTLSNVCTH